MTKLIGLKKGDPILDGYKFIIGIDLDKLDSEKIINGESLELSYYPNVRVFIRSNHLKTVINKNKRFIQLIKDGRIAVRLICHTCEKVIEHLEPLIITAQGEFRHSYCYFPNSITNVISDETYDRLSLIPEDITNLEDCLNFLIKFYFDHQELTKAQKILSSEDCRSFYP